MTYSAKNALSLCRRLPNGLSATFHTLGNKIRRDGFADFVTSLIEVCTAEQPLAAIAKHRQVVEFFNQPSMAPLRSRSFSKKYLSRYLTRRMPKLARRNVGL